MEELETLDNLNFEEQIKTIDICACGPLRVSASLINGGMLKEGSKIIMITSQGGSVTWRTVQNPTGHDYGHHVSAFIYCTRQRRYDVPELERAVSGTSCVFLSCC